MSNLQMFDINYENVLGIKVKDQNGNVVTYAQPNPNDWLNPEKPEGQVYSDIVINSSNQASVGAPLAHRTSITSINLPNATEITASFCANCTGLKNIILPSINFIRSTAFQGCTALEYVVLPSLASTQTYVWAQCTSLKGADFTSLTSLAQAVFSNCANFNTLILRNSTLVPIENGNAVNGTAFNNNSKTATLYVPQSLISEYQSATTWSSILARTGNSIVAIEGSEYETHYVDGSLIPTGGS